VCSGSAEYVDLVSGVGVWVVVLGWCVEEVWGRVKCRVRARWKQYCRKVALKLTLKSTNVGCLWGMDVWSVHWG
jgi:hypothetical protein